MFYYSDRVNSQLAIGNLIHFYEDCYDIFNSEFIHKITELPEVGRFQITDEINRPDLVSYKLYGTVHYWRYILMYNELNFSSDLKSGLIIKTFSTSDLNVLIYNLKNKKKYNRVIN